LRLGGADGQRHGCALAGALPGHGVGERLPDQQPAGRPGTVAAGSRAGLVVPVLLRHRARAGRLRSLLRRLRPAHLAVRVAGMALRRSDIPATAAAFHNPDHVAVVIHNYRWRIGLAAGEPQFDVLEERLAAFPAISVPTITLEGDANRAPHPEPAAHPARLTGKHPHPTLHGGIGHNLPKEAPQDFAAAIEEADSFAWNATRLAVFAWNVKNCQAHVTLKKGAAMANSARVFCGGDLPPGARPLLPDPWCPVS